MEFLLKGQHIYLFRLTPSELQHRVAAQMTPVAYGKKVKKVKCLAS